MTPRETQTQNSESWVYNVRVHCALVANVAVAAFFLSCASRSFHTISLSLSRAQVERRSVSRRRSLSVRLTSAALALFLSHVRTHTLTHTRHFNPFIMRLRRRRRRTPRDVDGVLLSYCGSQCDDHSFAEAINTQTHTQKPQIANTNTV